MESCFFRVQLSCIRIIFVLSRNSIPLLSLDRLIFWYPNSRYFSLLKVGILCLKWSLLSRRVEIWSLHHFLQILLKLYFKFIWTIVIVIMKLPLCTTSTNAKTSNNSNTSNWKPRCKNNFLREQENKNSR